MICVFKTLADYTKEKTKAMFEAKITDLTIENEQLQQRIDQNERDRELSDRAMQTRHDELVQTLQEEKQHHVDMRTKYHAEKDRAEQVQRQVS
jgi:hypothetical protein